jgi:hypothetical protein
MASVRYGRLFLQPAFFYLENALEITAKIR